MSGWGTQCGCRTLLISDVIEIVGKPVYAPQRQVLQRLSVLMSQRHAWLRTELCVSSEGAAVTGTHRGWGPWARAPTRACVGSAGTPGAQGSRAGLAEEGSHGDHRGAPGEGAL